MRYFTFRIGRLPKDVSFLEWERELLHVRFALGRTWVGWNV